MKKAFKNVRKALIPICFVIVALIVAFVVYMMNGSRFFSTTAASVNGEAITVGQIGFYIGKVKEERLLSRDILEKASDLSSKETGDIKVNGKNVSKLIKNRALELAIQDKIEIIKAREKKIQLSDADLYGIDDDIRLKKTAGAGIKEQKEQFYKYRFGMDSEANYRKASINSKIAQMLKENMIAAMKISDNEMKRFYALNASKYKGSSLEVKVISFKTVDSENKAVSDAKLKEIDATIGKVLLRAKAGEDFGKLVQEYSQDEESKKNGGLRTFSDFNVAPEIYSLFRNILSDSDKIQGPVAGDKEKLIIKYEGFSELKILCFEEVKAKVLADLQEEKYAEVLKKWFQESEIKTFISKIAKIRVYWN